MEINVRDYNSFSPEFETLMVSALVTDDDFAGKFLPILNVELVADADHRFLVDTIRSYSKEYGKIPSTIVLKDMIIKSLYQNKGGVIDFVDSIKPVTDIKYIEKQIVKYMQWREIDDIIYNKENYDTLEFAGKIDKASRIGDNLLEKHSKMDEDNNDDDDSKGEVVETPWKWLNNILDGGTVKGDLAIVLAVIGGGKTTALINIAYHAMKLGLSVVYFTFEDGERKIKRRLSQLITGMSKEEILTKPSKVRLKRKIFFSKCKGTCDIKNLFTRVHTVQDAMSFVKSIQATRGKVDLVITDYADRFGTIGRYNEPRHALREIFEDCKRLARELNVVHWTARQVNKTVVGKNIITYENASESWGSMESADLVLGMGQTMEDALLKRLTFYTSKVRDAEDHQSVELKWDKPKQKISELERIK